MPKSRPELYFHLHAGMKAKDLIKRGVPVTTAYAYSSRYKHVVKKAIEDFASKPVATEEEFKNIILAHRQKYNINIKKKEDLL